MKLHYCTLLVLTMLFSTFLVAQQRTIKGSVSDPSGLPFPGVLVIIQNSNRITQTDFSGEYTIQGFSGETLSFSLSGFDRQDVTISNQIVINITMKKDESALEEIVRVGYGTKRKRALTDNIIKLTTEDIKEVPVSNFQSTLVGKAAGVQITQTNGKVEADVNVRIRGTASINSGTQPLYVLDGIPLYNADESNNNAPVNPLLNISPNEIESINILKDASSAAIYGARGANGVVLITTKKGREGKAQFSINSSHGFSTPTNTRKFLNTSQYVALFREAAINSIGSVFSDETEAIGFLEETFDGFANGTDWRTGEVDTDWTDLALRDGEVTDADFSMSGGSSKTNFFLSGAFHDTKGIVKGNNLQRFSSRINVDHKFSSRLLMGSNMNFSRSEIDRVANDGDFLTPLQAVAQTPLSPAFLEDGRANPNTLYANFLLQDQNAFYKTLIKRIIGRIYGEYEFVEGLKLNSSFAYDVFIQSENFFAGRDAPFQLTNGEAFASNVNVENYILSNVISYDKTFTGQHTLGVIVGTEFNETSRRFASVISNQFPSDDFPSVSGGLNVIAGEGNESAFSFLSYFARATYGYQNKYLLKASLRRDGSSRFGSDKRFGTFGAFSAGWIISDEIFLINSNVLSFLKLRASWGKTGNAELTNFPSRSLFEIISYDQRPGISFVQAGNPNLTWETTEQTDIGLEFGFLKNRIAGEIDYYIKKSDGLLFSVPVTPSAGVPIHPTLGVPTINQNTGEIMNSGIEFTIHTKNIAKDNFEWNSNFNISNNKNEIISIIRGNESFFSGVNINKIGEVVNAFFLPEYAGVDPANGDALYFINSQNADLSFNKETTNNINEANPIVTGNPFPTWYGGFTNTMKYKNLDFSFTFQGEFGASIYNAAGNFMSSSADSFDNQTIDQLDRWQQPGDITDVPQARLLQANGIVPSTRYLHKADFIRLRNITLGYSIPKAAIRRYGFSKVRVYVTGLNVHTFTDYEGMDPEARSDAAGARGAIPSPGQEFYSAPPAKVFSLGLNLNF